MKLFNIIFGILSLICAIICFAHPFATAVVYGYIIAFYIGIMGICAIISYFNQKKQKKEKGIEMAMGTASLVLGIIGVIFFLFNLTIPGFTIAAEGCVAALMMLFIFVEGIMTIISSVSVGRKLESKTWGITLTLGILMVVLSTVGLSCLTAVVSMFGWMAAIGFVINSVRMLVSAFEA